MMTKFTFLAKATQKWTKHMNYQATKTVISERRESEVSPKMISAHLLEFPATRQGPADLSSWESKTTKAAIVQRKQESFTEREF